MSVYENEMRGEKKKGSFNNSQDQMRGEKGKKMKEPGGMESGPSKFAAGGVGKIRHGAATMSGAPKMQPRRSGRGK
jgi:hypothetical protein